MVAVAAEADYQYTPNTSVLLEGAAAAEASAAAVVAVAGQAAIADLRTCIPFVRAILSFCVSRSFLTTNVTKKMGKPYPAEAVGLHSQGQAVRILRDRTAGPHTSDVPPWDSLAGDDHRPSGASEVRRSLLADRSHPSCLRLCWGSHPEGQCQKLCRRGSFGHRT